MKPDDLWDVDEKFMKEVDNILFRKQNHYTREGDVFSVFRTMATMAGHEVVDEMLYGFRKHVVAFMNLFKPGAATFNTPAFLEHGGDIINYIRLINAYMTWKRRETYGHINKTDPEQYKACDLPDCCCHIPGELCIKENNE